MVHLATPFLSAALGFAPQSVAMPAPTQAFPPDAEHAAELLKNSPRHGEWVEVPAPKSAPAAPKPDAKPGDAPPAAAASSADAKPETIKTWVVYPERKDAAPVVLVIHEIFGMTDWVRGVADALAAEGFIAVAPDLLSGKGPNGGGTDSFQGDKAREAIGALSGQEVARRLDAVRAYALALPSAKPASACIGFCWGGSTSFAYAAAQPDLKGAIVYYGTAPTDKAVLGRIACQVTGFYGGDDARVTSTVEATATTMRELGKSFTSTTYNGAGHGFLRQQAGRDGANLHAARDAWSASVAFLKRRLETAPAPSPAVESPRAQPSR